MTAVILKSGGMDDLQRGAIVFRGDVIVFRGLRAMPALQTRSTDLIRAALDDDDPMTAHQRIEREDYALKVAGLQMRHRKDDGIRAAWKAVLADAGCALEALYWDWCHLRSLPPGADNTARATRPLAPHRDTWCSNLYAQVNWWVTLYPLTEGRSMVIFPDYWVRALKNNSANWDLEEMRSRRRPDPVDARARPKQDDYPVLPVPQEPVDTTNQLRLVVEPGDLLCFSGTHLHASVPNETDRARFSLELRTVWREDAQAGRGAPNLDGAAPHVASRWFKSVTGGEPLPEQSPA